MRGRVCKLCREPIPRARKMRAEREMAPSRGKVMTRRFHMSLSAGLEVEFPDILEVQQENGKPRGLWYDVDLDWVRWVVGEDYENDPRWMRPYLYEVFIDKAAVLKISSVEELDAFHERYARPLMPEMKMLTRIDWPEVARSWNGVEIAPYSWRRRLAPGFLWYYSWDCASGVIWNPVGLKKLQLIAKSKKEIQTFYRKYKQK